MTTRTLPFTASQFTPTEWATAEEKAAFATKLARFIEGGCLPEKLTQVMYTRLHQMFGFIANYNIHGFRNAHLETTFTRLWFVKTMAEKRYIGGGGDPHWTWSDVERAIETWCRETGQVARFQALHDAEVEARERAELARLQAKYGGA